jgi:hypothetical protein
MRSGRARLLHACTHYTYLAMARKDAFGVSLMAACMHTVRIPRKQGPFGMLVDLRLNKFACMNVCLLFWVHVQEETRARAYDAHRHVLEPIEQT